MAALISVCAALLFSIFSFQSIYPGDAGDLVTAAWQGGIPHPPGYPLYTFFGWLVTRIPWSTPAWQMTWLSLIPHSLTVGLVFLLVYKFTRQVMPALFSALLLTGNYLFFLYSITPEVFALLDLFVIALISVAITLKERFDWRLAFFLFFLVGLSLSHHHLIIFLFPALFFYSRRIFAKQTWTVGRVLAGVGSFVLGLLPYMYIPIAAGGNAIVNWDRPTTWARFIQLITRADYGTFVNGGVVGRSLYERLLNVKAYGTFLVVDFTWIGIMLAFIGFMWLWKYKRDVFFLLASALFFLGPGFIFYASFSVINRFVLGTYERFLLPSYVLLAIMVGIGAWASCDALAVRRKKWASFAALCMLVLLVYPLTTGAMTVWRFWGSRTDQTTDVFLQELLRSAPPDAIILVSHDTPLFGSQYMRYVRNVRPDTTVLHLSRLALEDYHEVIANVDPTIVLPVGVTSTLREFIENNEPHRPIATNTIIPIPDQWVWVPHGLLFVLTKKEMVPDIEELMATNATLWDRFSDPTTGLLSRYNHLMLSNVRDEYAGVAIEYGKMLVRANQLLEAKKFFERAIHYESDTQQESAYTYLGLSQLFLKECDPALNSFTQARSSSLAPNPELFQYEAITYRDCLGDASRAAALYEIYGQMKREKDQPLEQL